MAGPQPVLLDPAQALAVHGVEAGLRRRGRVGVAADEALPVLGHADAPPAVAAGDALGLAGLGVAGDVEVPLQRRVLARHEVGELALLIDVGDPRRLVPRARRGAHHRPVAVGDGVDQLPLARVEVQVVPARALAAPDEGPVLQRGHVVVQVDPGRLPLGQHHARGAGRGVHQQQVQPLLVARLALDVEGAPVLGPIDPGEVDVGVRPQVDAHGRAAGGQRRDVQLHHRVRTPRPRVALLQRGGAGGVDVQARDDVHAALVHARIGDARLIGAEPVARVPVHLLLRDELGQAEGDRASAVGGDRALAAAGEVVHVQVLVADVADPAAVAAELGVGLVAGRARQPLHGAVGGAGEVEVAAGGHQDLAAFLVPTVLHDAARADALALAARLLGLRQFLALRLQRRGVDQPPRLAAGDGQRPQVLHRLVVGLGPQEGDEAPVRADLHAARRGAVDVRIGEGALGGQLVGGSGGGEGGHEQGGGDQGDGADEHDHTREGRGGTGQAGGGNLGRAPAFSRSDPLGEPPC